MKAYRLTAWPDADLPQQSTGHRRMLSDMSQRHMTAAQLAARSGLGRGEVRSFLATLSERGLLAECEVADSGESVFSTLFPLGGWLRRALSLESSRR